MQDAEPIPPYTQIEQLSQEDKSAVFEELLPHLENNPNLIISGSLALKIAEIANNGKCNLPLIDFSTINDIDIMATSLKDLSQIEKKCQHLNQCKFPIEIGILLYHSGYPNAPVRNLAVAEIYIITGKNSRFTIYYSTPEMLLLTLVDQIVSKKTPKEKYQRKVVNIQKLPNFSQANFERLANYELTSRNNINKNTFEQWKGILLNATKEENNFRENLQKSYDDVSSLVDQVELFNRVKTSADLKGLQYEDVRKISRIEWFLRQMYETEEMR